MPGHPGSPLDLDVVVSSHVGLRVVEDADPVRTLEVVSQEGQRCGRVLRLGGLVACADRPVHVIVRRPRRWVMRDPHTHGALVQHVDVREVARLSLRAVIPRARSAVRLFEEGVGGIVEGGSHEEVGFVLQVVVILRLLARGEESAGVEADRGNPRQVVVPPAIAPPSCRHRRESQCVLNGRTWHYAAVRMEARSLLESNVDVAQHRR
mmetsp:Transcript_44969/g.107160  ORF Transcript_44969/g.107160 Transcript_44969/m.107160 type:complete len:208 (+) Transcript_44969:606-1229(+)